MPSAIMDPAVCAEAPVLLAATATMVPAGIVHSPPEVATAGVGQFCAVAGAAIATAMATLRVRRRADFGVPGMPRAVSPDMGDPQLLR